MQKKKKKILVLIHHKLVPQCGCNHSKRKNIFLYFWQEHHSDPVIEGPQILCEPRGFVRCMASHSEKSYRSAITSYTVRLHQYPISLMISSSSPRTCAHTRHLLDTHVWIWECVLMHCIKCVKSWDNFLRSTLVDIRVPRCGHTVHSPPCVNVSVMMRGCVCVVTQCAEGALGPSFKGRKILISPRLH